MPTRPTPAAFLAAAIALCAVVPGLPRSDEPTPVTVEIGKPVNLCKQKLVACPVSTTMCDDSQVARLENGPDGVELKGITPGKTLCSVLGFERAFRRVLSVTVKGTPARSDAPAR